MRLDLVPDAAALALVAYSESIAGARTFAVRDRYPVDANAELLALGASNLGAGVTQGFPVDASLSRSAVADAAGVRTPLFNLFELVLVVVTLIALTPLVHDLPETVLGAIVITAVAHFFNFRELRRLWTQVEQVLVDAGAISYMDTTASDVLSELIEESTDSGVSLAFARVKAPLHARLKASGVERALGEDRLYSSVRAGVDDYLDRHPGLQPTS